MAANLVQFEFVISLFLITLLIYHCLFSGYYCVSGVDTDTPSGSGHTGNGGQCYKGHECPGGTSLPIPCTAGYYAPATGMASCIVCPKGNHHL